VNPNVPARAMREQVLAFWLREPGAGEIRDPKRSTPIGSGHHAAVAGWVAPVPVVISRWCSERDFVAVQAITATPRPGVDPFPT
jgi:hypothetical protein